MKNMEELRQEELEVVSGGNYIDTGNMGEAAKVSSPPVKDTFEWLKPTHK